MSVFWTTRLSTIYQRCIDDGCAVWKHHPGPVADQHYWRLFQCIMNKCGVSWTFFSDRYNKTTFLDMNVWIKKGKQLTYLSAHQTSQLPFIHPTKLLSFSRSLQRTYMWAHSMHLHDMLPGKGYLNWPWFVIECLLNRGCNCPVLKPIFSKANHNATNYRDEIFKSSTPVKIF